MKTIIMFILLFWLLPALPACDEVISDNPINVIGDTVYVFLVVDDKVDVFLSSNYGEVTVVRLYDDYHVTFEEEIEDKVNKVIVTLPTGSVYIVNRLRIKEGDKVSGFNAFSNFMTYVS